ncbi:RNI-like protein [Coniochaeta ligniaria NRRL 30616]|uniref:RNI-like protein n=1 Tax=Coniochaeta ligniaria NRRL 30616 TaxID=1408157 RepID=A0A1J7JJ81_9PEZI|nr:RNI-like protein [Coniochaeta ligniaria NRRL 30616]
MDFLPKKKHKVFIPPLSEESDGSDFMGSPSTTLASSPASSEGGKSNQFFQSFRDRARRSFSLESLPASAPPREPSVGGLHSRKLSKSRNSASTFDILSRRSSGLSEDYLSRSATAMSTQSTSSVDWKAQKIEGVAPLERDPQLLRNKNPYIVVTTDYVVKMKGHSDTMALFPKLSTGSRPSTGPPPEPLLTIPIHSIVSVFASESTRPSFGLEIWWRVDGTLGFKHTVFYFNLPNEREEQMQHIVRAINANNKETSDYTRFPWEVSAPIRRLFAAEEPSYQHQELNIFPVVPRGITRKDGLTRDGEKSKSVEGRSYYLAIGAHLCCYIEISKGQVKRGELILKHSCFGLVTLECLRGHWTPHEERFIISFRDPFKQAITLELASRYYRSIIRVLHKADRYLKPAWPQMLQNSQVFLISGLREPQYVIDREDYGGIKRTLDAYLAAYRSQPVEWEINWRTKYAPEFRLLPPKIGKSYAPLQLLAVMRALRYNDYFISLSFRDIDLSVLWGCYDHYQGMCDVPYLSRSCLGLGNEDIDNLFQETVLYNEVHALAFCSEKVRQIDFTNTFKQLPVPANSYRPPGFPLSVQFLSPIFHLLEAGATKCSRLLMGGNELSQADIASLTYISRTGLLQALDVSRCGLCDMNLRDLLSALSCNPDSLQLLDVSGNNGRVPAVTVPDIIHLFTGLKELNLGGCLIGTVPGPLIPCEALERLSQLRDLDISQYKVNDATIIDLEEYLLHGSPQRNRSGGTAWTLRRLALNNCGITGKQAAKLFNAIGEDRDFDLSLNGNPLEEGVEYLAHSIRHNRGPKELHMDMVEFRDEENYCVLIKALTATRYLTFLSLVGTGPTPPAGEPLQMETCEALENFFAHNTSIRYLNYSGYKGKLDEGQMALGFGHSLRGLADNDTLTHLWIRNQNLHDDIGTLGTALRKNTSLQVLDCQDNGFNMTTMQFLTESVKENYTLTHCPFTMEESEKIWIGIRDKIRGPRTGLDAKRPGDSMMIAREAMLKEHYEALLAELEHYLERNRRLQHEAAAIRASGPITEQRRHEEVLEGAWMARSERSSSDEDLAGSDGTPKPRQVRRQTIRSSGIAINTMLATPYQVLPEEGMESPTETIGPASRMSVSPPEATSPTTPDDASFEKLIKEFKQVGFESSGGRLD